MTVDQIQLALGLPKRIAAAEAREPLLAAVAGYSITDLPALFAFVPMAQFSHEDELAYYDSQVSPPKLDDKGEPKKDHARDELRIVSAKHRYRMACWFFSQGRRVDSPEYATRLAWAKLMLAEPNK